MRNKFTCWIVSETMSAYLDGELTQNERATINRHLASCARCAAVCHRLSATQKLAVTVAVSPAPLPFLSERILKRLSTEEQHRPMFPLARIMRIPPLQELADEWVRQPRLTSLVLAASVILGICRVALPSMPFP
jgi:anti-sigma factor RsiW